MGLDHTGGLVADAAAGVCAWLGWLLGLVDRRVFPLGGQDDVGLESGMIGGW